MRPRRPGGLRALVSLVALLIAGGCSSASTNGLDVGYPEAGANRAMLGGITPLRMAIGPVVDRRADAVRVGSSPIDKKDIVTRRPVTDIVRDALVVELGTNGHAVVGTGADAAFAVDIDEFWLDLLPSYGATHYVGKVAVALAVTNGRTGERVVARRYTGIRRQLVEADSRDARRAVMDAALARTMHDLATDRVLVTALSGLGAAGSNSQKSVKR